MKITIIGIVENCDALEEILDYCRTYETEEGQAILEDEKVIDEEVIGDYVDFEFRANTKKIVIKVKKYN